MATNERTEGIASGRLSAEEYNKNFADLHPPLEKHEALVESDRCYFCYDAPCMNACPTGIDIAMFIRQISTHNTGGAAKTIFEQNILFECPILCINRHYLITNFYFALIPYFICNEENSFLIIFYNHFYLLSVMK